MKNSGVFFALLALALVSAFATSTSAKDAQWTVRNKPRDTITVIAHRGAGDLAPENCLSSLELSWSMGAVPEVDVRSTKDGRIVMFHDGNFERILPNADPEFKKKTIADLTYDEVRALASAPFAGNSSKARRSSPSKRSSRR